MKNFVLGYARVSTEQQNLDRQLDMLQKYGVDFIYNEKMTGTKRNRPELEKLLERLTEGDTVVVESLSRLGRSTKDLIWLMETFNAKGVNLVSLKESIDTTTSTGKLLFTLMSAIAQFERDVIADRTREGLNSARARGRKGGRPRTDSEQLRKAININVFSPVYLMTFFKIRPPLLNCIYVYLFGSAVDIAAREKCIIASCSARNIPPGSGNARRRASHQRGIVNIYCAGKAYLSTSREDRESIKRSAAHSLSALR